MKNALEVLFYLQSKLINREKTSDIQTVGYYKD